MAQSPPVLKHCIPPRTLDALLLDGRLIGLLDRVLRLRGDEYGR